MKDSLLPIGFGIVAFVVAQFVWQQLIERYKDQIHNWVKNVAVKWIISTFFAVIVGVVSILVHDELFTPPSPNQPLPSSSILITSPKNGDSVGTSEDVQGTISVSQPDTKVWIIVHPIATPRAYWVQDRPASVINGQWNAPAQMGENGQAVGESFEIMAVANPILPLSVGATSNWPSAKMQSPVIKIVKNKS